MVLEKAELEKSKQFSFAAEFLDIDTVRVRNPAGVSVTFSVSPDMSMKDYDNSLEAIEEIGWGPFRLMIHPPEEKARRDVGNAPGSDNKTYKLGLEENKKRVKDFFGLEWEEFSAMKEFAHEQLVVSYAKRLREGE